MPDNFPKILKDYTKEVVRKGIQGEQDIIKYSMVYFEQLLRERVENGATKSAMAASRASKTTNLPR